MPYKDPEKRKEYMREYQKKNILKVSENTRRYNKTPKGVKAYRVRNWKKRGILSDDYDALYERYITTENCVFCGVCLTVDKNNTKTTRCLDHDHESGQVRGVLCHSCNAKDVLGI